MEPSADVAAEARRLAERGAVELKSTIASLRERLERQRETLMLRFQKMESTLGRLSSVRSSIEQFVQAASKGG